MTKTIAYIAICLVLITPVSAIVQSFLPVDRDQISKVNISSWAGDMEDADDSSPSEDSDSDENQEAFIVSNHSFDSISVEQEIGEPIQVHRVVQRVMEVSTPPPRS